MFCFSSPFGRREGGGGLSEGSGGIRVEEEDGNEGDPPPGSGEDPGRSVIQLQVSDCHKNEVFPGNAVVNNSCHSSVTRIGDTSSVGTVHCANISTLNNEASLTSGNKKSLQDLLGSGGDSATSVLGSASSAGSSEEGMGDEEEDEEGEGGEGDEEGPRRPRRPRRLRRRSRRRREAEEARESLESGCSRGAGESGTSPSVSSGGGVKGVGAAEGRSGSSDSLLSPPAAPAVSALAPRSGPRFKLLAEGDVQVCVVQHCRGLVGKVLASKFLRRWEMHHLYLNDTCISSRTPTGFMESSIPYCSMEEVHSVARWDASHRFCVRIIIPTGSILLQANNSYTRDQWYHSIVWKKNIYKHRNILRNSTRPEVILREVKSLVSLATNTPLQDECVAHVPLQIVSSLLAEEHPPWSSYQINSPSDDDSACGGSEEIGADDEVEEEMVWAIGPLLEDRPPPPELCRFFSRRCTLRPRSSLVPRVFTPVVHRILKHNVDFGKHPHMRRFVQDYIRALHSHNGGCDVVRGFVSSVHGQTSGCPHPRVLPNLVSVCLGAVFSHFETRHRRLQRLRRQRQMKSGAYRSETEGEAKDTSSAASRKVFKLRMCGGRREISWRGTNWDEQGGEGDICQGKGSRDDSDSLGFQGYAVETAGSRMAGSNDTIDSLNAIGDSKKCVDVPAVVCIHSQKDYNEDCQIQSAKGDGVEEGVIHRNGGAPLAQQEEDVEEDEEEQPSGEGDKLLQQDTPEVAVIHDHPVEVAITKDVGQEQGERIATVPKRWQKRMTSEAEEAEKAWKEEERTKRREEEEESQLKCYLTVFLAISEYDDWRPGLAQLLQPIPFPDDALAHEPFLSGLVPVVRRIGSDPRCEVHQMVLGVREGKPGLFSLYCPTSSSSPPPYFSPSPMPSPTFPFPTSPTTPSPFPQQAFQQHLCPSGPAPVSAPPFPTSCPSSPYSGPPYSAPPFSRPFHPEDVSYDDGSLWCEILGTLLGCCCRRKQFVSMLACRHLGACMLLALRDQAQAQDALCLMLEWNLLGGGGKVGANGPEGKEKEGGKEGGGEGKKGGLRRRRTVRRRIIIDGNVPGMNLDEGRLVISGALMGCDKSDKYKNSVEAETVVSENQNFFPKLEGDLIVFGGKGSNVSHRATTENAFASNVDPKLGVFASDCSASGRSDGNKSDSGRELETECEKLSDEKLCDSVSNVLLQIFDPIKSKASSSPVTPLPIDDNVVKSRDTPAVKDKIIGETGVEIGSGVGCNRCDDRLVEEPKNVNQGIEEKLVLSDKLPENREVFVEVNQSDEDEDDEEDDDGDDDDEEEDQRTLQVVTTLQSTESGRSKYAALCQRQMHLRELHLFQQQKGGPRKLSLPPRSTDADVTRLVLGCWPEGEKQESLPLERFPLYGRFGSLECLSLAFTHVTSACATHLIHIPTLRYLNLWSTQFGDAGLQLICEHLHRLQVLNLCETPVTDKGIICLTALKNLRRLNLNSTRLSPETFERLKAELPGLQECDVRYTDAW